MLEWRVYNLKDALGRQEQYTPPMPKHPLELHDADRTSFPPLLNPSSSRQRFDQAHEAPPGIRTLSSSTVLKIVPTIGAIWKWKSKQIALSLNPLRKSRNPYFLIFDKKALI